MTSPTAIYIQGLSYPTASCISFVFLDLEKKINRHLHQECGVERGGATEVRKDGEGVGDKEFECVTLMCCVIVSFLLLAVYIALEVALWAR